MRPSKGLGQNFLINEHYLQQIVAAAAIKPADLVIEIGSGLGTLTVALAASADRVVSFEKDARLAPVLQEILADLPHVELLIQDALQVDYLQVVAGAQSAKVVANLPYYITTPLIMRLLEQGIAWKTLVLLVQTEVAQRLMALAGSKAYGLLSAIVQCHYTVTPVANVPANAFYPAPKVTSAVVKLVANPGINQLVVGQEKLWDLLRAAFGQRRKTLVNALSSGLSLPKAKIVAALMELKLEANVRGEDVSPPQFIELANVLADSD